MKIMFVIDSNLSGGAERVVSILCNYLSKVENEVLLVNFDDNSSFYKIDDEVNWIKIQKCFPEIKVQNNKYIKKLLIMKSLHKIIKKHKPDVVIPFLFDAEFLTIPYCVRHRIPCITSVRNDANSYPKYQRLFRRFFYPKMAGIVFQSEAVKNHADFRNLNNAIVIPNPISLKINEAPRTEITYRKIISVGRLTKQKNHEMTIMAVKKLIDKYPDIHLFIFGEGEDRERLEQLIDKLDLSKNVSLEGVVSQAQFKHKDAQAFIMSSNYEGFPNALVEAIACHIPTICTDFGSGTAREILENGKNGWLIPLNDYSSLANSISECFDDPEMAELKACNAAEKCKEFEVDIVGKVWNDYIYQTVER